MLNHNYISVDSNKCFVGNDVTIDKNHGHLDLFMYSR